MDTSRIKNALWGAFIADSIAMPAHWYYRRKYIQLDERYHYHHDLKKGENTLGANLLRVLMRSVTKKEEFVKYMTTPGLNKDPYSEVYVRAWFNNFTDGVPPHACAQEQRDVWSIGSSGGAIRPLLLSLTSPSTRA